MEDKRIAAQKRAAEYNRKMIGQLYRHFKGDFWKRTRIYCTTCAWLLSHRPTRWTVCPAPPA